MQKDAFYFPHFSNARIDRKIRRMRKELGLEGYGIYFMILETLREQAEYKYPIEDMDLLADEFGTSEQKVRTVVCNYELFTVDEDQMFFSPKLIMYLQPYLEGKERKRIGGIRGNLIKYKHITSAQSKELSDDKILELHSNLAMKKSLPSVCESESDRLISQMKVNETDKVNEIKKVNNESKRVSKPTTLTEKGLINFLHGNIYGELYNKLFEFYRYRKEIKKPLKTIRSISSLVNAIGSDYKTEEDLIWCIDYTMNKEYQGVNHDYLKYRTNTASSQEEVEVIF